MNSTWFFRFLDSKDMMRLTVMTHHIPEIANVLMYGESTKGREGTVGRVSVKANPKKWMYLEGIEL